MRVIEEQSPKITHHQPRLAIRFIGPKNVDHVVLSDALQDPVQGNEGPAPSNTGTARKMLDLESRTILMVIVPPAVDDYWPLLRADAVPERSHEPVGQVGLDGHDDTIKEGNEVGLKILVEIMDAVEQMLI